MKTIKQAISAECGYMAMMAAILLSSFSLMVSSQVTVNTGSNTINANLTTNHIAEQNSFAGLEYAKLQIHQGKIPTGTKNMSKGSFSIVTDPGQGLITSTGYYGNAVVAHSITSQFGKDCVSLDTDNAHSANEKIVAMMIDKANCGFPDTVVVDKVTVTCPAAFNSANIIEVSLTGNNPLEYSDPSGTPCGQEIDIINHSMTNPGVDPFTHVRFDSNIPGGLDWTIQVCFTDGSCIEGSFLDPTGASDPTPNYSIPNSGNVQVDSGHSIKAEVLGSSISCGSGGPEIYVKAWFNSRNAGSANWGSWTSLYGGADVDGGESYTSSSFASDQEVKFKAKAWLNGCYNKTYESTQAAQVKTLMNGDQAPALAGFGGQQSVQSYLAPYLDADGLVQLPDNQILLLWELGVDMNYNPGSTAADFQDLVMLLTIN